MYPGKVNQRNPFGLPFDLKLLHWQVINHLYSETYKMYLWVSVLPFNEPPVYITKPKTFNCGL